jgi:hypothetical protein
MVLEARGVQKVGRRDITAAGASARARLALDTAHGIW